jgi:predicted ester cyclase
VAPEFVNHTRQTAPDRESLKQIHQMFFTALPDLRVIAHGMVAERDMVVVRKTLQGTHLGELLGTAPTRKR